MSEPPASPLPDSVQAAMSKAIEPVLATAMEPPPARMNGPMFVDRPAVAPRRVPNRVYDHLVEGGDDVIGLVTYALYKQDKREWLMSWRKEHDADPTEEQIEAFVAAQMTASQRDRYRTAARQVLDAYAMVAVDVETPQIIREAVAGRVEAAARRMAGSARWWRQIPAALMGALLAAAVIIGVIAALVALDVDLAGYLGIAEAADTTAAGAADGAP